MFIKRSHKKGFTLVEALVSVSIVTLIMSSVLFNYVAFNDDLALGSAGQELAISVRQAQTYGLTVREVTKDITAGGRFSSAYGIHFNVGASEYYIFADLDGDGAYDEGGGCGSGLGGGTECVEKITLRNSITIYGVGDATCPTSGSAMMSVTFLRPNPDARVFIADSVGLPSPGASLTGKVVLTSQRGKRLIITIENTGQVLVEQIS